MRRLLAAPATLERLAAALDGTGPALLPTTEPRVLAALRPDEPLESDHEREEAALVTAGAPVEIEAGAAPTAEAAPAEPAVTDTESTEG